MSIAESTLTWLPSPKITELMYNKLIWCPSIPSNGINNVAIADISTGQEPATTTAGSQQFPQGEKGDNFLWY